MITTRRQPSWDSYPVPPGLPPVVVRDPSLPLVSIVTPSYNQGNFIRETIDSVLGQTYPNIEYWVIDGGSTDNTISILKEYGGDPRFHWISEKDRGQSDAINKGWSRCRGEIIAWLNSDDTYLPGVIQSQVQALREHPECGIVYGDVLYTDQLGAPLYTFYGRPYSQLEVLRLTIPIQPTTFIRRSLCDQIGPIDVSFRYSMDSEYWSRAAKVTDFWYVPQTIATYRLHNESKTVADYSLFYRDWIAILDNFFAEADAPKMLQDQKQALYADVYGAAAAIEAKQGSLKRSLAYTLRSVGTGKIRPRLVTILPSLIDRYAPFDLTTWLVQRWTYLRSKQRAT